MPLPAAALSNDDAPIEDALKEKLGAIARRGEEERAKARAAELGLPFIALGTLPIAQNVLSLISEEQAQTFRAIPFVRDRDGLHIATPDPLRPEFQEFLRVMEARTHVPMVVHVSSEPSFLQALERYKRLPAIHEETHGGVEIRGEDIAAMESSVATFAALRERMSSISMSELLTVLLAGAVHGRASDIHIETEANGIPVRYRIDGVLHDIVELPRDVWSKFISRIKLVAGLKMNVADVPQDGRFTIFYAPPSTEKIDVRISVLPTAFGESVVMRLLMSSALGVKFEQLGITGRALEMLSREITRPNGMILTTGPTGSGKTTTLYAILQKLNSPENKIITVEDPIEYKLEGVNQSQVEAERGYTFANGLRSIVRQDPDIIMVGEIRDLETADIAIQAALTGHLVLSTLHTNSASGTVPRLLSMGAKPFLLAPAINVMIAQRLVRRLCDHCKKEAVLDAATLERVKEALGTLAPAELKFSAPTGCEQCNHIGYHGRIGIYEVMSMTPEIEQLVLSGNVSEYAMDALAVKQGMVTMVQDGLLKATEGITSVDEVFRVAE